MKYKYKGWVLNHLIAPYHSGSRCVGWYSVLFKDGVKCWQCGKDLPQDIIDIYLLRGRPYFWKDHRNLYWYQYRLTAVTDRISKS